jgi:hypothetical protein
MSGAHRVCDDPTARRRGFGARLGRRAQLPTIAPRLSVDTLRGRHADARHPVQDLTAEAGLDSLTG